MALVVVNLEDRILCSDRLTAGFFVYLSVESVKVV